MKKAIILCFFSLPLYFNAQNYKSALGIKLGYPGFSALNLKSFLGRKIALDNSLGVNFDRDNRFLAFTSLVEYNKKLGINPGYNWYAGAGPGASYFVKGGYLQNDGSQLPNKLFIKGDAVFGLEFSAPRTHLNAAIEGGPSVTFYPIFKFSAFANVAVRYTFKNDKFR